MRQQTYLTLKGFALLFQELNLGPLLIHLAVEISDGVNAGARKNTPILDRLKEVYFTESHTEIRSQELLILNFPLN